VAEKSDRNDHRGLSGQWTTLNKNLGISVPPREIDFVERIGRSCEISLQLSPLQGLRGHMKSEEMHEGVCQQCW